MRFATWNVNSIRSRLPHVLRWLRRVSPELLLLQEIKCEEAQFPRQALEEAGYRAELVGQKSYNGVALLSRVPMTVTARALDGLPEGDAQARYIEAIADGITFGNLYLPNGNSGGEAGFAYKLGWMERLAERAQRLLDEDRPLVLAGDYNICPTDADYAPGTLAADDALVRPEARSRFRRLAWMGLTDALRAVDPRGRRWTFWDYQGGAWQRDRGLRIDHAMLSPALAERLVSAAPERSERGEEQPSDHVPLLVELA